MKAEYRGKQIEIEANSKPYLLKRLLADGFDIVLVFALFMLFTSLIMRTSLADTYRSHYDRYKEIEAQTVSMYGNDAKAISEALSANNEYRNETFAANLHSYLLKALAAAAAEILILVGVPFVNRDRATPGKLLTGVMPFYERGVSRITWYQVVFRFLFVFLFDSLALYLFTGIYTFLLVPVLRITEMLTNKKNKTICDLMTGVRIIEKISYDGIN